MQLLKFVPIKLTFFLVAGILTGHTIGVSIIYPLITSLVLLIILGFLFQFKKSSTGIYFGIVVFATTFSIGLLSISLANPLHKANHFSKFTNQADAIIQLKITEVLKHNEYSTRYFAEVLSVAKQKTTGEILLSIPTKEHQTVLKVDDELLVFDKIEAINTPLNPHQFNYKNYLSHLGVFGQIPLKASSFILKEHASKTLFGIAANWREKIIEALKKEKFGQDELSIMQALLLGQRNDISDNIYDTYKDAGAVHILAVSGLHVGILLLILQFLLQPLKRLPNGHRVKLIVIVLLLWTFAFIAGLSASVVRAVTMFSFLAYALSLNRPANTFNILALSLFVLLLWNPNYIFQAGFQMSYAAVFAILWIYPKLQGFWYPKLGIVRKIWQLLSVSMAAQLGVLPISLFYFHQFPSLFFISNLIIVPFLGIILGGGLLVIILSLANSLPDFIANGYNEIIRLMNLIVSWVAEQEAFVFKAISFDGIQLILTYILIFCLVLFFSKPSFKKIMVFLGSILLLQSWLIFQVFMAKKSTKLVILHQTKHTGILVHKGNSLKLWSNDPNNFEYTTNNYSIHERISSFSTDSLANSYQIANQNLYILDSLAIYPSENNSYDIILLTQSPNINLERLLKTTPPSMIIADGSNYTSDVLRWKATCEKQQLPFHYTGEKGAYYIRPKQTN